MAGHRCYHCKEWVEEGAAHDCWTTTEAALTQDLSEELRDAWERLRETAAEFGEQRIYASHHSIMFSREACYFFVRPRTKVLEVWVFLGRTLTVPQVRKAVASSKSKVAHLIHVRHRDEVEAPITDWLREAYDVSPELRRRSSASGTARPSSPKTSSQKAPPPPQPSPSKTVTRKRPNRKTPNRKTTGRGPAARTSSTPKAPARKTPTRTTPTRKTTTQSKAVSSRRRSARSTASAATPVSSRRPTRPRRSKKR